MRNTSNKFWVGFFYGWMAFYLFTKIVELFN